MKFGYYLIIACLHAIKQFIYYIHHMTGKFLPAFIFRKHRLGAIIFFGPTKIHRKCIFIIMKCLKNKLKNGKYLNLWKNEIEKWNSMKLRNAWQMECKDAFWIINKRPTGLQTSRCFLWVDCMWWLILW
jgi:hypothetical protein